MKTKNNNLKIRNTLFPIELIIFFSGNYLDLIATDSLVHLLYPK